MIKYPCGAGGIVADEPSGKESTYKLGNSTYTYLGYFYPLYPAAYYATNISVNAPNLGAGNWWIPSVSEMAQMMRDITYSTRLNNYKKDIVNTVLGKLQSPDNTYYWNYIDIDPSINICTSSLSENNSYIKYSYVYHYGYEPGLYYKGCINRLYLSHNEYYVTPITIYEF